LGWIFQGENGPKERDSKGSISNFVSDVTLEATSDNLDMIIEIDNRVLSENFQ
jgi:hypothetical protein